MFVTKKGRCCAVNSLCLTLYENQILALLGMRTFLVIVFCFGFFLSDHIDYY